MPGPLPPSARPTPAERIARAQSFGMVARGEYLTGADETAALTVQTDGLLDAWLERVRDRLLVVTPTGWINPKSRTAYKSGLHSFQVRGAKYHEPALKAGRFTPGASLRLLREPQNPHDPNAIAIYAEGSERCAGYVPATIAKRLARLMDTGTELVAVSTRGADPRQDGTVPQVLVCTRTLYDHLTRDHQPIEGT